MAQLCEDHSVAPAQTLGGYDIPVLKGEWFPRLDSLLGTKDKQKPKLQTVILHLT